MRGARVARPGEGTPARRRRSRSNAAGAIFIPAPPSRPLADVFYLLSAAVAVWFLSRSRLWRWFFGLRREIRASLRRGSFAQYYAAVRARELAGLLGFVLAALAVADAEARSLDALHRWAAVLLVVVWACIGLYALYLAVDVLRLRRRFRRLMAVRHRYVW